MELVGFMVLVLLAVPNVLIWVAVILMLLSVLFLPTRPRRVRKTFRCPVAGQVVSVDFLVRSGFESPVGVAACTAFPDPGLVMCGKTCVGEVFNPD